MTHLVRLRILRILRVLLLAAAGGAAACDAEPIGGADLRPAVVEGKRWARSVVVEQRRMVDGEGWEVPDSADVVRRERRFHHEGSEVVGHRTVTRQVPRTERVQDGVETRTRQVEERVRTGTRSYVCGQRDLGNGYFEDVQCQEPVYETRTRTETYQEPRYREVTRQETVTETVPVTRPVPVYRTWYTWRAPRWVPADTLHARGDTTRPAWPDSALGDGRRRGRRTERYTLVVREGRARLTLHTYLGEWHRLRVGQRVALRHTTAGDSAHTVILPADSLFECRRWHRDRRRPPPDSLGCSPLPPEPAREQARTLRRRVHPSDAPVLLIRRFQRTFCFRRSRA